MVEFTGQITAIGPAMSGGYPEGDLAELYFECSIQGKRSWYDNPGMYGVFYDVHLDGQRIYTNSILDYLNFGWPHVLSKEWHFSKTLTLMPMPARSMVGVFVLKDFEKSEMDRMSFVIPWKDEPPIPPPSKWPWKEMALGFGAAVLVGSLIARKRRI